MSRNEEVRLQSLYDLGVLDSAAEPRFDRITQLAADMFGAPIALVSLVDEKRQWFKSRVGIDATETPRDVAFCAHAIQQSPNSVMVVENATLDPRFADNPFVTGDPDVRFYAGATLTTSDGENVGTLCVIDDRPRPRPSEAELEKLRALAALVVDELELSHRSRVADQRLALLELAEAMSGVGYWRFEVATSRITWSDEVYAIHGVDPATFDPNLDANLAHFNDADRAIVERLFRRAVETGEGYDFELHLRRADGEIRNVACKARCEKDALGKTTAVTGVFQDVTDYVRAREDAQTSEALYRLIASNTPDIIGRLSLDGLIHFVSPSMKTLTGHAVEDVLGRKSFDFMHKNDIGSVIAAFREIMAGRPLEKPLRYRIIHKSGEPIWVEANPRLIIGANGKAEFIDVLRDIRGQIALEESMQRATAEAQAAARAKSEFLANMSHEIRTPLNAIVGYSSLMAQSPDMPPHLRRHANVVSASSNSLIRIVNDILDFSALEAGAVEISAEAFDIRKTIDASVETLRLQAVGKGLALRHVIHPAVEQQYIGDSARLQQVLMNLIGNAIKFTSAGEVEVRCSPMTDNTGQTLYLSIRDTGIGIDADKTESLFSRFTQADGSVRRRFGGTGLGLAVSKQIVTLMGGSIDVDSIEGEGSTFWITLPLRPVKSLEGETAPDALAVESQHAQPRRILFVDDHDVNRELGAILLSSLGHEVVLASDGAEAIAFAERESFDIVFMDVQMPGLDGLSATRAIRSLTFLKDLPIIALTAHAMRHQVADCLKAGMNGHLAKPFTGRTLEEAIDRYARRPGTTPAISPVPAEAIEALRQRFIADTHTYAVQLDQYLKSPSADQTATINLIIHRLAGTAGSLGFAKPGQIALAIEQAASSGRAIDTARISSLIAALEEMQAAS